MTEDPEDAWLDAQAVVIRAIYDYLPHPQADDVHLQTTLYDIVCEMLGRIAASGGLQKPGVVKAFARESTEATKSLYGQFASLFPPVEVAGAGIPLGAAAPRRVTKSFTFLDRVSVDVVIEWSATFFHVTASTSPIVNEQVLVFVEDPRTGAPLAVVALPSGRTPVEQIASIEELGFDPTAVPWKFRVVLA